MKYTKDLKLVIVVAGVLVIGAVYFGAVFASHSFEVGVSGNTLPDNTHIRLDGLVLPPSGVLPVYDSSPNFVAGHFLLRAPCDDDKVPLVTVIAGHIDESAELTHMDKIPLFYIDHASTAGSCVYHAHVPDPLNGGPPRVTDIALINLTDSEISFNHGDVVDVNIQRVLGNIGSASYEGDMKLPSELTHGNPVFNLNDENPDNDGLGTHGGGNHE